MSYLWFIALHRRTRSSHVHLCSSTGTSTLQIFFPTASHRRIIWSLLANYVAQRRLIHHLHLCSHDDAPNTLGFHMFTLCLATCTSNSTDRLSHWIIIWSSSQLSEWRRSSLHSNFVSGRNHVPFLGAFSQVCKLENVSRSCNHQHSLLAREAFFIMPSLTQMYSEFCLGWSHQ